MTEFVSLKELLQIGRLGKIYLGQPENEIIAMLGTPDYAGGITRSFKRPSLFSYGDLELYFDYNTRSLTCINLNFLSFWQRKYPSGGKSIHLDPWVIKAGIEADKLIPYLRQEEISFCDVEPINYGTRQLLINSTVNIIFNNAVEEWVGQIGLCKLWAGN